MSRVNLSEFDIDIISTTEEGRAYIEYNEKIGGDRFGLCEGMPDFNIEEKFGGEIGLYKKCIKQNITWEKLLETDGRFDKLPE